MKTMCEFDVLLESAKQAHLDEVNDAYRRGLEEGACELSTLANMNVKTAEGRAVVAYLKGGARNLRERAAQQGGVL